jgi:hypothetical protein
MMDEVEDKWLLQKELLQAVSDNVKQLVTLSTGSLLLLTAFIEKVFTQPKWRAVAIISLLSFAITILLATRANASIVNYWRALTENKRLRVWLNLRIFWTLAWITFNIGVAALVIFVIKNLL